MHAAAHLVLLLGSLRVGVQESPHDLNRRLLPSGEVERQVPILPKGKRDGGMRGWERGGWGEGGESKES